VVGRLAALRLAQFGLFVLVLSILLQYVEQLMAVRMDELRERLEQRKHHEVDETDLQAQHFPSPGNENKTPPLDRTCATINGRRT